MTSARYAKDFTLAVTFSTGETRLINFLPLFDKHVKGDNLKYFAPERFRKFIVKNGNLYWGKNEDVIFPVAHLLQTETNDPETEEVLYII